MGPKPFRIGRPLNEGAARRTLGALTVRKAIVARQDGDRSVIVTGLNIAGASVRDMVGRTAFLDLSVAQATELRDSLTAYLATVNITGNAR